jgi:hypothetical protein
LKFLKFKIFEIFYQPKVSCKPLPAQFETKHQKVTFCNRSPQKKQKISDLISKQTCIGAGAR